MQVKIEKETYSGDFCNILIQLNSLFAETNVQRLLIKENFKIWRPYCFPSFRGERSWSSFSNPKRQIVCYPNLKKKKNGNNDEQLSVVLIFSPTDEKTHTVQSVAARSIVHKFLTRSPGWTKPERVIMGLLRASRLASIS